MPQWRKLHTKIKESDDFNELQDDFTRLLFVMLTITVDREGRGIYKARWVQSNVFPIREDVTLEMIDAAMQNLADHGMIIPYTVAGRKYFYLPTFSEYQKTTKEAPSTLPPPPPDKVETYSGPTLDQIETLSGTDTDTDTEKEKEKEKEKENSRDFSFSEDWEPDQFDEVQHWCEQACGVPAQGDAAIKAIQEMVEASVIQEDIQAGVTWLRQQGKVIRYYGQIVGPAKTAQARRLNRRNGRKAVKTLQGVDGRVITVYDDGSEEESDGEEPKF